MPLSKLPLTRSSPSPSISPAIHSPAYSTVPLADTYLLGKRAVRSRAHPTFEGEGAVSRREGRGVSGRRWSVRDSPSEAVRLSASLLPYVSRPFPDLEAAPAVLVCDASPGVKPDLERVCWC